MSNGSSELKSALDAIALLPPTSNLSPAVASAMSPRLHAAMLLRVPDSGTEWLDDMIHTSLRDHFAAKVIPVGDDIGVKYAEALLGRPMPEYSKEPLANAIFWADARSRLRYIEADAMLKMRGVQ